MTGNLDEALKALIESALPGLFGGVTPSVTVSVASEEFDVDPDSADASASAPRPDDRTDNFAFDSNTPEGPYTLTNPPYPGPRRIRLTTDAGDRIALRDNEISWDVVDPRIFTLSISPIRDLTNITGVQALYGVTAVFTKLKAFQTLTVVLDSSDAVALEQAEALVTSVTLLNRQNLIDSSKADYQDGDYGASIEAKSLILLRGESPSSTQRQLVFRAEIELKATRALAADEGLPIERIISPGRPVDPNRNVDIHIQVDA